MDFCFTQEIESKSLNWSASSLITTPHFSTLKGKLWRLRVSSILCECVIMCQHQLSRSNSVCTQRAWWITRKVLTDRLQWLWAWIQFPGKPLLVYYMILKLPNTMLLHLCLLLPSVPSLCSVNAIPDIHKFSLTRNSEPPQVQHPPWSLLIHFSGICHLYKFYSHIHRVDYWHLQSKYICSGRMSSESVYLIAFAVSCFFTA